MHGGGAAAETMCAAMLVWGSVCHLQQQCLVYSMPLECNLSSLGMQDAAVAKAMCADVALLGTTHLIKKSKWNRHAGAEECLCRISKVRFCLGTSWIAIQHGRSGLEG